MQNIKTDIHNKCSSDIYNTYVPYHDTIYVIIRYHMADFIISGIIMPVRANILTPEQRTNRINNVWKM